MLKRFMQTLYMNAHALTSEKTLKLLRPNSSARLLDLGCDEGTWTTKLAGRLETRDVHGMEVLPEPAIAASARGIQVKTDNLEKMWPYADNSIDVVHSSFVIEHVASIDHFISEMWRVLKPGGYGITTTENGSSWHNIIAAVCGWQTFSSSCCSTKVKGLGNPFALQRGMEGIIPASQTHKVIFNYAGFREIFEVHGFEDVEIKGSGYYPLPAWVGSLDPRHAHFLAAKAFKPHGSALR